jgi:hypothetical protein
MGEMRNAYIILVRKPKTPLRQRKEANNEMDLKETGFECVD